MLSLRYHIVCQGYFFSFRLLKGNRFILYIFVHDWNAWACVKHRETICMDGGNI